MFGVCPWNAFISCQDPYKTLPTLLLHSPLTQGGLTGVEATLLLSMLLVMQMDRSFFL